jgi:hypothetical protein
MTSPFKVAIIGPSRVGKTTLLTAVLSETERMLAGSPVSVTMDETTGTRVRRQRLEVRRAIESVEFNAAALGGTEGMSYYRVSLQSVGDETVDVPFSILDFPGGWLDPDVRNAVPGSADKWAECEAHIKDSLMLLVPIDSAVLMEAAKPAERRSVADLLAFEDVEAVTRKWVTHRNLDDHRGKPAVLVLAPLKCEKYFDDNFGHGRDAGRLRQHVREKYGRLLEIIKAEAQDREVRVIYAPIDTYGCVELMEVFWIETPGSECLEFKAHYRFRDPKPQMSVKAAGAVMQELCRCVISGWDAGQERLAQQHQTAYQRLLGRHAEVKGLWRRTAYVVSGEARRNSAGRAQTVEEIEAVERRRRQVQEAVEKMAATAYDPRVEEW